MVVWDLLLRVQDAPHAGQVGEVFDGADVAKTMPHVIRRGVRRRRRASTLRSGRGVKLLLVVGALRRSAGVIVGLHADRAQDTSRSGPHAGAVAEAQVEVVADVIGNRAVVL